MGKDVETIVTVLKELYRDALKDASGDVRNALADEAEVEVEAYNQIKMVSKGEGIDL